MKTNCLICLNKINNPLFLECSHGFCSECIIKFIHSRSRKCPICRLRITWTIPRIESSFLLPVGTPQSRRRVVLS